MANRKSALRERQEAIQHADDAERERQEERRRAEQAERERQEERRRAEQAERERQEERRRADASEEEIRPTTIDEYIAACHTSVFSKFIIETDPKLSSRGSITNLRNKWCPKNLWPWTDFIHEQRLTFGILNDTFLTESRVFKNRAFLAGLDEKLLKVIIHKLKEVKEVTVVFEIGDGIVFENHPHALSDTAEEVVERETSSTPRTPDHRRDLNQLRPDQIFVNRKTIPTSVDLDALFQYYTERLTASAITQTYHYMIESGLEYGNLTIEPRYEVSAHPSSFHVCTAVGQYLAFTLIALGLPGEQPMDNLKTWAEDFETILHSIPENEQLASSDHSPDYQPTTYRDVKRSPYLLRRRRRRTAEQQTDETVLRRDDRREPSDNESARPPDTPTPAGRSIGQASRRSQRLARRPRGNNHKQSRQGGFLDPKCPNAAFHCKNHLTHVTLLAYGYTFLGKGTAAVYYYFYRVYVVHIIFLSWGGDSLADVLKTGDAGKTLQNMAITSLQAMHQEGVIHRDVRFANMLFNREVNRVIIIDFKRASLIEPPRLPLAQLVLNKCKQRSEERESKNAVMLSCNACRASRGFSEDIANARMVF
ncbi:hypothetical protein DER46DRAFT_630875 [Fusarium sp. MPI-SDFR-AT-0072]|nr:hypothetical protein DER46DRAFT_630875 [Fusarium sp. MPI-SDFR-AT-0072]